MITANLLTKKCKEIAAVDGISFSTRTSAVGLVFTTKRLRALFLD